MIEVRMSYQNQINRRKVSNPEPRLAQALQYEKPAGKVWIDHHILAADLQKEAGVTDKCQPELLRANQNRTKSLPAARLNRRLSYKSAELPGTSSKGWMAHVLLDARRGCNDAVSNNR
jgi:hypothetical protein